jgi:hypothetical protein
MAPEDTGDGRMISNNVKNGILGPYSFEITRFEEGNCVGYRVVLSNNGQIIRRDFSSREDAEYFLESLIK